MSRHSGSRSALQVCQLLAVTKLSFSFMSSVLFCILISEGTAGTRTSTEPVFVPLVRRRDMSQNGLPGVPIKTISVDVTILADHQRQTGAARCPCDASARKSIKWFFSSFA